VRVRAFLFLKAKQGAVILFRVTKGNGNILWEETNGKEGNTEYVTSGNYDVNKAEKNRTRTRRVAACVSRHWVENRVEANVPKEKRQLKQSATDPPDAEVTREELEGATSHHEKES